jgi:hypothetical protein
MFGVSPFLSIQRLLVLAIDKLMKHSAGEIFYEHS